jgi:hypothetical protein
MAPCDKALVHNETKLLRQVEEAKRLLLIRHSEAAETTSL